MPAVRVPPKTGPQIVITNNDRHVFDVGADGLVQCETQADADLLVALIEGAALVEPAPDSSPSDSEETP